MNRANRPRLSRISGSSYASKLLGRAGDGSTLTLDFTTGVLDPRLSFSRSTGGSYVHSDGLLYGFDTSSTSNTIGTGSKTFTLSATAGVNRRYAVGNLIIASSGANNMSGSVTSYDPATQALVCNITGTPTGSGTFTTWIIGNRQPRFDYDPTTLAPRGLLVEGQSVNLARYSETIETTGGFWGYNAATRTVESSDVNPTGGTGSISFAPTTNGGSRYAGIFLTGQTTASTYTYSVWLKGKGTTACVISIQNSAGGQNATMTILSQPSGANASVTGNGTGFPRISNLSTTGWTKVQVVLSANLGGTGTLNVFMYPNETSGQTTADSIFAWGAQLEAGSGASSYIPTGASTATRNADECSMTGTNFSSWFNAGSSYSMLFRYSLNNPSAFAGASVDRCAGTLSVSGGGNRTFIHAAYRTTSGSGDEGRFVRVFDTGSLDLSPATLPAAASNTRLAFAVDTNNAGLSAANQSLGTDSGCTILTGQNQLELGKVGSSQFINGCISLVKYWPTRLPNAQLQSLTT
jgi:hypothetical protein